MQQGSNYFEITFASKSGDILRLLLRPVSQNAPTNAGATIQVTPDYSDALKSDTALCAIAAENEEVFALATGSSIAASNFRDEVPGLGTGRFFYRIRALDAAGNTTSWSALSVPFYQVDTTLPNAPSEFRAFAGKQSATLVWLAGQDSRIAAYLLYRTESNDSEVDLSETAMYVELNVDDLRTEAPLSSSRKLDTSAAAQVCYGLSRDGRRNKVVRQLPHYCPGARRRRECCESF